MSASGFRSFWQRARQYLPTQKDWNQTIIVFGSAYVFTSVVGYGTICVGPSMIPTIDPRGELALVDRISYTVAKREYKVNDVVISLSMTDPKKTVCKRIGGVAGDVIFYRTKTGFTELVKVPAGHVWLQGDNPSNSNDSRNYGPVPLGLLQGRVVSKISCYPSFHISFVDTIEVSEEQESVNEKEEKLEEGVVVEAEVEKEVKVAEQAKKNDQ